MHTFFQDIRYGFRMLVRNPGFTILVVLVLALGIGVNTAIFSVVNAVLLRPLPYKDPDSLVRVYQTESRRNFHRGSTSYPNFIDWRDQNHVFEQIAGYQAWSYNLTGGDRPERNRAMLVSAEFFPLLGIKPALGRTFFPEDELGGERVVLLSHGLWQRRFGSDPSVIGKTMALDDEIYTVIGVMPADFRFIFSEENELWIPLSLRPADMTNRSGHYLEVIARLRPDTNGTLAQEEMDMIGHRLEQEYPDSNTGIGVSIVPLKEEYVRITSGLRQALIFLLGTVGLVLLITCLNVANLLLARATARQKEISIRGALGASRLRLIRQLLTESVLLAVLAGLVGLLLAVQGIDLLSTVKPDCVPRFTEIHIDTHVLVFTMALSLLTGGLFGLAPALQTSKINLSKSLKEGSGTSTVGFRRQSACSLLVVSQIALALVLLVGAGLMINSFLHLQNVNPGFNPENVLSMDIWLIGPEYFDAHRRAAFLQQILERTESLPGVEFVDAVNSTPLSTNNEVTPFTIDGRPSVSSEDRIMVGYRRIFPNYFRVMEIPLLKGRYFTEQDTEAFAPVAIINETMARRFWPNEDPIGKRISNLDEESELFSREIVGVVGDVRQFGLATSASPELYVPYLQNRGRFMQLVVRTASNPESIAAAVQSEIWAVDKNMAITNISCLKQRVSDSISPQRFNTLFLGAFAAVALVLATVGIYSMIAYSVSQRTHEFGIRMALGAQATDVLRLVVRQGMKLALIGVAVGLIGAFALTRVISSLLYEVRPTDPLTFVCVSLFLTGVALLASYIPARRATKVDPMVALKYE